MKLWDKGKETNRFVENFTRGNDPELDHHLAAADVLGTIAHIKMLHQIGVLSREELHKLHQELVCIYHQIETGDFQISPDSEDVHSQIEEILTQKLGDTGKKVHTARSRNDQVLMDIRLFIRDKLADVVEYMGIFFQSLIDLSEKNKDFLMPGYTHLQIAMPSSFGLWFGSWAEALTDDLNLLIAAWEINNQNPLGSAAGYGSSFPINRELTSQLAGFDDLVYNVMYAQMGRGKTEKIVAFAVSNLASTIGKMAGDVCLFMCQNFGFFSLPDEFTTGSSIMPHKKNPDLFETIRGRCNRIQAIPFEISMISGNLNSGYYRDYQLIKNSFLPVFSEMIEILKATNLGIGKLIVNEKILDKKMYDSIFTVEEVNRKVFSGIPFREAYRMVSAELEAGTYCPVKKINHSHQGSIGNLCNKHISDKFSKLMARFNPEKISGIKKDLIDKPE